MAAKGFSHRLDLDALAAVSAHFREVARTKGLPLGQPQEYDAGYYHHQLAGGMVSTTRRMLEELRRPELFGAVLEEVGRVRAEMGYPIIVTPVSQQVATQAVRNVIDEERWSNVSDETIRYFLGHFGEPPAPVDADVAERVLSRPRVAELRVLEPVRLEGARARFGRTISDEELLLRLTMPKEQVDAIGATAPGHAALRGSSTSERLEHDAGGDAARRGREATLDHAPPCRDGRRAGRVASPDRCCELTGSPAAGVTPRPRLAGRR